MTDNTTPQDDAAMPPASTGSVEPVAWAVEDSSGVFAVDLSFSEMDRRRERASFKSPCRIVPLYRQPQPTLTPEERQALDRLCHDASDMIANDQRDSGCHWEEEMYAVAMTRALLDRLG